MEYRTLGNTGLLVSRLCLGTMTFGHGDGLYKSIGGMDQQGVEELVRLALDAYSRTNQKPEGARRSEFDFPIVDKERTWKVLDAIAPIAKAHNCSPARVALAWLLTRPVVTSVIVGARRRAQLEDNLAATDLKLTAEEIGQLDDVSALPPEYPGWMLDWQRFDRVDATAHH